MRFMFMKLDASGLNLIRRIVSIQQLIGRAVLFGFSDDAFDIS